MTLQQTEQEQKPREESAVCINCKTTILQQTHTHTHNITHWKERALSETDVRYICTWHPHSNDTYMYIHIDYKLLINFVLQSTLVSRWNLVQNIIDSE